MRITLYSEKCKKYNAKPRSIEDRIITLSLDSPGQASYVIDKRDLLHVARMTFGPQGNLQKLAFYIL